MIQTAPASRNPDQPALSSGYDVVVIGGGPAGATTAALLAEHGHSVLLLERSAVPRFHVGESLIPETWWTLRRLGLLDRLEASAFPKKYSVQFISDGHKESAPFYFDEHNPHPSSVTWQVERGVFDGMLLDRARELGTCIRTDAFVQDVVFEQERAVGVKVRPGDDAVREIAAKVVVDASGQTAFLANRLNLKEADPHLKMGTVWTYFRGARRDPGKDAGATLIMQTAGKLSWFWYIPLPDDVVSIGCTGTMQHMFGTRESSAAIFQRELARCPALESRLQNAEQITDYFTTKDFSYRTRQSAGPGWVLVGDAGGFIDPVYSSGVFLALKSGEFAADAVHEALVNNDLSAERLGSWRSTYVDGVSRFRKLVYAFYAPGFSFGGFLKEHPQFRNHLVDVLIGNVFKPELDDMFAAMGDITPEPVPSLTAS